MSVAFCNPFRFVLTMSLLKCIYGITPGNGSETEVHEMRNARSKPTRVMILLLVVLLAAEALSVWLAFNWGFFLPAKTWGFDDVIFMSFAAFLTICVIGALGIFMAVGAGYFEAYKTDGGSVAPHWDGLTNQMMSIVDTYFGVVLFGSAVVAGTIGVWILVVPLSRLGLLGAAYLVAAVLFLQGSVLVLAGRNTSQWMHTLRSLNLAHQAARRHPEKLLEHVHFKADGGLPENESGETMETLLRPTKKDYLLFLILAGRMGINVTNTLLPAGRELSSLAGTVLGFEADATPSAQQLIVNLIEAVFVAQFTWQLLKTYVTLLFLRRRFRQGLIPEGLPTLFDRDRMLHQVHDRMKDIANYSLLRSISALNIGKAIDLHQRRSSLQFFQAIVHGLLAVISLSLKVSVVSPILALGVAYWKFSDWKIFVAFINNISGIIDLKEVEGRVVDEFIFGDGMRISDMQEVALHTSWRCRLSFLLLERNNRSVFKSLAVINGWSTPKTQSLILRRVKPQWMDEEIAQLVEEDFRQL